MARRTVSDLIRWHGIAIAVDITNSLIWWWNPFTSLWNNDASADPGSGTGGLTYTVTGAIFPAYTTNASGESQTANFGASTFNRPVPSGFSAWGSSTTWDPSNKGANHTLSNGNLTCTGGAAGFQTTRGTVSQSSGKYYYEIEILVVTTSSSIIGICNSSQSLSNYIGSTAANGTGWQSSGPALGISGDPSKGTWNGTKGSGWHLGLASVGHSSGKWYFEMVCDLLPLVSNAFNGFFGVATRTENLSKYLGQSGTQSGGHQGASGIGQHFWFFNGTSTENGAYVQGDTIGVAVDLDNMKVWTYIPSAAKWNNAVIGSQDPANNIGGRSISGMTAPVYPAVAFNISGAPNNQFTANFSQGSFNNTMPTGFSAWES